MDNDRVEMSFEFECGSERVKWTTHVPAGDAAGLASNAMKISLGDRVESPDKQTDPSPDDSVCGESWLLGTACGRCQRCTKDLLSYLALLAEDQPCQYDREDRCLTHDCHKDPCPHGAAREILSRNAFRFR